MTLVPGGGGPGAMDVTPDLRRRIRIASAKVSGAAKPCWAANAFRDLDLQFGKQHVGRQVRVFAPEQRHQQNAPGDDQVDGSGPGDALGGAVGEFLHLAAGLQNAVPILDAPAPGIVFDDPATGLGGVHGEGGEKQPEMTPSDPPP